MSQPLRWAYISIVMAVQEARLAASSSCGLGPASSPPRSSGSSAVSSVVADLDVLLQLAVHAAGDRSHHLPSNSSGSGSSAKRAMANSASESRLR